MNIINKKSGFTLIEIIIVIVIIGVLASLALPRLSNQIVSAQATEAIDVLGKYVKAVDKCYQIQESFALCNTDALIRDFSYAQGAGHFTYTFLPAAAAPTVSITAIRDAAGANSANDTVVFAIDTTTGLITKTVNTAGVYKGLKLK